MTTFFIVRNKHTKEWLPAGKHRNKTSARLCSDHPPRLFKTPGGAKNALNWWSGGVAYSNYGHYEDDMIIEQVRVVDRHKEDMEVVGVSLTVNEVNNNV